MLARESVKPVHEIINARQLNLRTGRLETVTLETPRALAWTRSYTSERHMKRETLARSDFSKVAGVTHNLRG